MVGLDPLGIRPATRFSFLQLFGRKIINYRYIEKTPLLSL